MKKEIKNQFSYGIVRTRNELKTGIFRTDSLYRKYDFENNDYNDLLVPANQIRLIYEKKFSDIEKKGMYLNLINWMKNMNKMEDSDENFIIENDLKNNEIVISYGRDSILGKIIENYNEYSNYLSNLKYNIGQIEFFYE